MGANIEKKTDRGRTALHVAAAEGHEELIKFLLDAIRDQAPLDEEGRTPLLDGLEGQHESIINILVNSRNGCKLTVPDGPRKMNTFAAAGEDKALRLYFKCGVSLLCKDALGRSPLHVAASAGRKNAIEYLLEQKADVSLRDVFGNTPLDDALRHDQLVVAYLLLEAGATTSVSSDVNYGWQVLHQKLEQDIPTLNLALESKKWEVQNAVEQNVFLQDALREVKHVSNSIREAIRQKVEKDRWAQICVDNNVPTDELASFKAKIEAHLETLSIQEGQLPP